ncbi:MAG TPA: hypothetical protein VGK67_01455 [Myxococcales bacterium]|jgi:hypothetical protein
MGAGIFNVLVGLAVIGLASTGKYRFVFLGDNPKVAMGIGAVIAGIGLYQVVRSMMRRKPPAQDD